MPDVSHSLGDIGKLDSFMSSLGDAGTSDGTDDNVQDTSQDNAPVEQPVEETVIPDEQQTVTEEAPVVEDRAPAGVLSNSTATRDYSGLDDKEKDFFKQMSAPAFNYLKPRWLEIRQKEAELTKYNELQQHFDKIKDAQFYQHEEAYQLSPDYKSAVATVQSNQRLANYWQSALAAVRQNQPIRDVNFDKDGNLVAVGEPIPPSPELEAQVLNALVSAQSQAAASRQSLNTVKAQFADKFKNYEARLDQLDNQFLAPPRKNPEFQKLEESILKQFFPPELHRTKVYRQLAGAIAMNQALLTHIEQLKAGQQVKAKKANVVRAQGPGESTGANGNANTSTEDPMEYLNRLKAHVGRA